LTQIREQGNGTPLLAFDGNFNDAIESSKFNSISVSTGLHKLNIRVKGEDGSWSAVFSQSYNG
jgi:hypothetical protein